MLRPFIPANILPLGALATLTGCSGPAWTQTPTMAATPIVAPSLTAAAPEPT